MSPRIRVASRLVFGAGTLAFVLSRIPLSQLHLPTSAGALAGLAGCIAINVLALGCSAWRWRIILGRGAPSWRYLWKLYLIGSFFSLFLPTSIGGDAVRAAAASQALGRPGGAVTSVIVDRIFGMIALVTYFIVGVALVPTILAPALSGMHWHLSARTTALGLIGVVLVGVAVVWMLARRRALPASILEGVAILDRLRREPRVAGSALALGLVVQALYIAAWGVLGVGQGLTLSWLVYVACVPLVSLAAMLPVTISGVGVREGTWVLLLAPFSVAAPAAVVLSLSYFFGLLSVGAIGGALFMLRGTGLHPSSPTVPTTPTLDPQSP